MSIQITRILSSEDYKKLGDDAVAAGMYRNDRRVFLPGMAWTMPFCYDPMTQTKGWASSQLSEHYWRDWSSTRPPICVICPNGEWWDIDFKSSNGTGWVVQGDLPDLIVTPSIVVTGYHGFLGSNGAPPGWFTADIEGRGSNGIMRS